jgi:hypothetical protein
VEVAEEPLIKRVSIPRSVWNKNANAFYLPEYCPPGYFPNSWCDADSEMLIYYQNIEQTRKNQEKEAVEAAAKAAAEAPPEAASEAGDAAGGSAPETSASKPSEPEGGSPLTRLSRARRRT